MQNMIERLNSLIDEAERSRAADPGFLRDLRRLAGEYRQGSLGRPRTLLLSDDFGDGDFTRNPRWTVTAGRYWVEQGWGLRSAIKPGQTPAQTEQKRLSRKEKAVNIFGQILQQAIDPEGRMSGGQATGSGTAISATAIQTGVRLANAFALEMDFSSWQTQGMGGLLEIGPYQGAPGGTGRGSGYILAYRPGGGISLFRVTGRGSAVIDSAPGPLNLEDKKTHRLEWTRSADGLMRVAIDGREILAATDLGLRGDFDGFRMVNRGGDDIIKQLKVYGAN